MAAAAIAATYVLSVERYDVCEGASFVPFVTDEAHSVFPNQEKRLRLDLLGEFLERDDGEKRWRPAAYCQQFGRRRMFASSPPKNSLDRRLTLVC
jgi:hypothetical protein